LLPDLGSPRREDVLSLLLIWDGLEVEITQVGKEDGGDLAWASELEEAGVLHVTKRPFDPEYPPETRMPSDEGWQQLAEMIDVFGLSGKSANVGGKAVADGIIRNVQHALDRAAREGLAPVPVTYHASLAATLPRADRGAPVREATLIDVATRGIKVSPETSVEGVLSFREKNAPLIGRFRASLIDLAAAIDPESSAPAEEAFALVKNRVEPALSALDDVLGRRRISFAWGMLLGICTTVTADIDAGTAVAGAGQVVTRGIRYAFNRDRLARDHPYGFLYRAKSDFDAIEARPAPVITDPEQEIRSTFEVAVGAAVDATAKAAREGRVDSTRLRRILDEQLPGWDMLNLGGSADG
jgi:hypothetical protein